MGADTFTVLVVCTGNVNRSALGAVLLERWAQWYLPAAVAGSVRVTSAGLGAPVGRPMGRRTRVIAEALGADGSRHAAQQITDAAIRSADLVLVSSGDQREAVLGMVPSALRSTFTIREAGRIAAASAGGSSAPGSPADGSPAPDSVEELTARVASLVGRRNGVRGEDDDIIDPQGKDDEAYRVMARQEVPPLARLAQALFGMPRAEVAAYDAAAEAAEFVFDGEAAGSQAPSVSDAARTRPRGRREA